MSSRKNSDTTDPLAAICDQVARGKAGVPPSIQTSSSNTQGGARRPPTLGGGGEDFLETKGDLLRSINVDQSAGQQLIINGQPAVFIPFSAPLQQIPQSFQFTASGASVANSASPLVVSTKDSRPPEDRGTVTVLESGTAGAGNALTQAQMLLLSPTAGGGGLEHLFSTRQSGSSAKKKPDHQYPPIQPKQSSQQQILHIDELGSPERSGGGGGGGEKNVEIVKLRPNTNKPRILPKPIKQEPKAISAKGSRQNLRIPENTDSSKQQIMVQLPVEALGNLLTSLGSAGVQPVSTEESSSQSSSSQAASNVMFLPLQLVGASGQATGQTLTTTTVQQQQLLQPQQQQQHQEQPLEPDKVIVGNMEFRQDPNDPSRWRLVPLESEQQQKRVVHLQPGEKSYLDETMNFTPQPPPPKRQSYTTIPSSAKSEKSETYRILTIKEPPPYKRYEKRQLCDCPNCEINAREKRTGESKIRFHICPTCGKTYGKTSHLRAHLRTHSGERPYECDEPHCNKRFTRSDELQRHKRTHSGDKRFVCTGCGKGFTRSDHMNKHKRTHQACRNRTNTSNLRALPQLGNSTLHEMLGTTATNTAPDTSATAATTSANVVLQSGGPMIQFRVT